MAVKTPSFADGATFRTTALFVQDEIEMAERFAVALGVRYSAFALRAQVRSPVLGVVDVDSRPSAVTASGYGVYRLTPQLHLVFGVGQGFRAPNVNDTTVLGEFAGGFEIPNPDIKPEHNLEYKAGVKAQSRRFRATATYYRTHYSDNIDVGPTNQNGLTFLDLDGNGLKDAKEPDLYRRLNMGNALIRGVEVEALFRLTSRIAASGNVTGTLGDDRITGAPLRRMPPVNGQVRIEWTPVKKLRLEAQHNFARAQLRLAVLDIKDPRIGPGGALPFGVSTVRASFGVHERSTITLALENLGDQSYKVFSSGFQASGFQMVLGYQQTF